MMGWHEKRGLWWVSKKCEGKGVATIFTSGIRLVMAQVRAGSIDPLYW
jgi:hypothetical protein